MKLDKVISQFIINEQDIDYVKEYLCFIFQIRECYIKECYGVWLVRCKFIYKGLTVTVKKDYSGVKDIDLICDDLNRLITNEVLKHYKWLM